MAHSLFLTSQSATVRNPGEPLPGGAGEQFLSIAELNWFSGPASRGRAYARDGFILHLDWVGDVLSAEVAGTQTAYLTVLSGVPQDGDVASRRLVATCSCPYGTRSRDWCKHVVALAFAAAALLDGVVDDQTGQLPGTSTLSLDREALEAHLAQLKAEPKWNFDPELELSRARRWLDLPPSVLREVNS